MIDFLHSYHFLYNVLILLVSTLITRLTIPSILHVARARHLYDDVGHFRKQHDHGIPRLGGVAMFVSFIITMLLFSIVDKALPISYLLIACIILFAMGLKD
ncbi:MraY family glycosyltransferase, partial [Mucilaginibacter sp. 22184]